MSTRVSLKVVMDPRSRLASASPQQVLASHHLDILLPHSDYLVKLHEGQVVVQGSMETLRSQGVLPSLVEEDEKEGTLAEDIPSEIVKDEAFDNAVKEEAKRPTRKARQLVKAEERSESESCLRLCVRMSLTDFAPVVSFAENVSWFVDHLLPLESAY